MTPQAKCSLSLPSYSLCLLGSLCQFLGLDCNSLAASTLSAEILTLGAHLPCCVKNPRHMNRPHEGHRRIPKQRLCLPSAMLASHYGPPAQLCIGGYWFGLSSCTRIKKPDKLASFMLKYHIIKMAASCLTDLRKQKV